MDLKNNKITLGELLAYQPAKAVIQRRFPTVMRHPLVGAAQTVTLEQIVAIASAYIPQKTIRETLEDLRRV